MISSLTIPILVALLVSVACGLTGTLTLVRRDTYAAGAVSHACFAGIGLARFLSVCLGWTWFTTDHGALVAALAAALFLSLSPSARSGKSDASLSALWAVGMACGLGFTHLAGVDAESLEEDLFGSLLDVGRSKIMLMLALDAALIIIFTLFHRGILSVSFNERAARLRGAPTLFYSAVIALTTALTVVLLVRAVGILLVVALLTLPAMAAKGFCRRLRPMSLLAGVIAFASMVGGVAISKVAGDFPPSVPIVFTALAICAVSRLILAIWTRLRGHHVHETGARA